MLSFYESPTIANIYNYSLILIQFISFSSHFYYNIYYKLSLDNFKAVI